jgi:DNA-directed RNA polymerase specialized sigma24 family protein
MESTRSVADAIHGFLTGIGDYGRWCGIRPWVVADIDRHFRTRPPVEGLVFLLLAQGYSCVEAAAELGIKTSDVRSTVGGPLRCMASLLDTGTVA